MRNSLKYIFCFVLGATSGIVASSYFLKLEHERILQEELESLREFYMKKLNENGIKTTVAIDTELDEDDKENPLIEKSSIIKAAKEEKQEYIDYANIYATDAITEDTISKVEIDSDAEETPKHDPEHPYVIKPEEFGELTGYSTISLSYYSDGILADENDDIVDSPEDTVGLDFPNHFGEFAQDAVYIRNDAKWCDYEILKDLRTYSSLNASSIVEEED